MEANFEQLMTLLTAGLIMPGVQWIKKRIGPDWATLTVLFALGLSCGCIWICDWAFGLEMTRQDVITYALGTQVIGQVMHAGVKQIK